MKRFNFVLGSALLILNALVGLADWLQGGYIWPVPILACIFQAAVLFRVTQGE